MKGRILFRLSIYKLCDGVVKVAAQHRSPHPQPIAQTRMSMRVPWPSGGFRGSAGASATVSSGFVVSWTGRSAGAASGAGAAVAGVGLVAVQAGAMPAEAVTLMKTGSVLVTELNRQSLVRR
jgi:hypothetical protein